MVLLLQTLRYHTFLHPAPRTYHVAWCTRTRSFKSGLRTCTYSYMILFSLLHSSTAHAARAHASCAHQRGRPGGIWVLVSGTIFSVDDRRRCEGRCVRTRIYTRIVFIAGCGFNLMQHEVCGDAPTSRRLPERARGVRDTYY